MREEEFESNDQFRKLYWMKKKKAWNPRKG